MSAGVTVTSTLTALEARMRSELSGAKLAQVLLQGGEVMAGEIRKAIAAWPDAPSRLSSKTGALARSFVPVLRSQSGEAVEIGVYSPLPYARIQDTGGTIKARNRRFLAVPLTAAARRVPPREFPGGLVALIRGNGGVLVPRGPGGRSQGPQYALTPSVVLPGHSYLAQAAQTGLPKVSAYLAKALGRLANGGK